MPLSDTKVRALLLDLDKYETLLEKARSHLKSELAAALAYFSTAEAAKE